ncbi:hypothetical protein [Kocuria arenosa]|uniref:hypothetical protein n=1 Tax=Kocuria arenosa TaxID=3071446 RepID=UPI0034D72E23
MTESTEVGAVPFEVIPFPHAAKWRVLLKAARAATTGLGDQPSVARYEFTALKPMPYQLDGEVRSVPANTTVRIESAPLSPDRHRLSDPPPAAHPGAGGDQGRGMEH